jgi:hypothetical protein
MSTIPTQADAVSPSGLDGIYMPLACAVRELGKRWSDATLAKQVHEYLSGDVPEPLLARPHAISTAHVASPTFVFGEFYRQTAACGLEPLMFEYLDDLFVTTNYDKAALAKMRFRTNADGKRESWHGRHVIDLAGGEERKRLRDLHTLWGESFVECHHRLLRSKASPVLFDGSAWYSRNGGNAADRYRSTMALFIRNGILFENFLDTPAEHEFTFGTVIPAFHEVSRHFGVRPLVVATVPHERAVDRFWWSYPGEIASLLPPLNGHLVCG